MEAERTSLPAFEATAGPQSSARALGSGSGPGDSPARSRAPRPCKEGEPRAPPFPTGPPGRLLQCPLPSIPLSQTCFGVLHLLVPEHHSSGLSWQSLSHWDSPRASAHTGTQPPRLPPREGPFPAHGRFLGVQGVRQTGDTTRLVLRRGLQPPAARARCRFTAHRHRFASFETRTTACCR